MITLSDEEESRIIRKSGRPRWIKENVRGNKILDIGFIGEYKEPFVHMIVRKNNQNAFIVGLDNRQETLFRSNFPNSVVGDGFKLPFKDNSFDAVVFSEVIEHVWNPKSMLDEISRVLTKNGRLYLTTPNVLDFYRYVRFWLLKKEPLSEKNYKKYLGAPDHVQFYDPLSLCRMFDQSGFDVVKLTTTNFSIPGLKKGRLELKQVQLNFFPFNRISSYICMIGQKR